MTPARPSGVLACIASPPLGMDIISEGIIEEAVEVCSLRMWAAKKWLLSLAFSGPSVELAAHESLANPESPRQTSTMLFWLPNGK